MPSLRLRLLLWLLLPMSIFVGICAWLSWKNRHRGGRLRAGP